MKNLILAIVILVSGLVTAQDDWRSEFKPASYKKIRVKGDWESITMVPYEPTNEEVFYRGKLRFVPGIDDYICSTLLRDGSEKKDLKNVYDIMKPILIDVGFEFTEEFSLDAMYELLKTAPEHGGGVDHYLAVVLGKHEMVEFVMSDRIFFISYSEADPSY